MSKHFNILEDFNHKYFSLSSLDIITYNLNVLVKAIPLSVSLLLALTSIAGFSIYIAYFKSREVNESRLLNSLTSILAITYIITTLTSFINVYYQLR